MDNYIAEILKEVNTIIIPELGALTVTNPDKMEIMFLPFLKHDDGKLVGFVTSKEQIDPDTAKEKVTQFVRELRSALEQGKKVALSSLGVFSTVNGDITFDSTAEVPQGIVVPDEKESLAPAEELQEEALTVQPEVPEEIQAPSVEATSSEEKTDIPESLNDSQIGVHEVVNIADEGPKHEIIHEVLSTPPPRRKMNIAEKEELSKNVEKLEKLKKQKEQPVVKRKFSVAFWVFAGLILALVSGGIYVGLNFDELNSHFSFGKTESTVKPSQELEKMKAILEGNSSNEVAHPESENADEQDTAEVSTKPVEIEVPEPKEVIAPVAPKKQKTAVSTDANSGLYHLIAGVFSSADNAQRMKAKLDAAGYTSSISTNNGKSMVVMASYASLQEAQSALPEAKIAAPKVWVYTGKL